MPTTETLMAALREQFNYADIAFPSTPTDVLLAGLTASWKRQHYHTLVRLAVAKIAARFSTGDRPDQKALIKAVQRLVAALPDPWRTEADTLFQAIFSQLTVACAAAQA